MLNESLLVGRLNVKITQFSNKGNQRASAIHNSSMFHTTIIIHKCERLFFTGCINVEQWRFFNLSVCFDRLKGSLREHQLINIFLCRNR